MVGFTDCIYLIEQVPLQELISFDENLFLVTQTWNKLQAALADIVENPPILRTISVKYLVHLAEDQERIVEDRKLRLDKGDLR